MMGHDDGLVDLLDEQLAADFLAQRGVVFFQEAALAGQSLDDALVFQFGIGLGDGVAIEAKFFSQRANGRERLAGLQSAGGGGGLDLVDQLEISGLAGFEIDMQEYGSGPLS